MKILLLKNDDSTQSLNIISVMQGIARVYVDLLTSVTSASRSASSSVKRKLHQVQYETHHF